MFIQKLNKKQDGSVYVIEEEQIVKDGKYEGMLEHDNVDSSTLKVYTGTKLTGEEILYVTRSVPSDTPWKTYVKIYTEAEKVYLTYETPGDTVEADDINTLQETAETARNDFEEYKLSNDADVSLLKGKLSTVEVSKAEEVSVAERLLTKADKENTYSKEETDQRIEGVIGAAPEALDTLKEIADSLNNDSDFAATMTTQFAAKVDKASGKGLSTEDFLTAEKAKLAGIETGAEVNNLSDSNAALLTGASDTVLHYHSADRNRANHSGTQAASTISDFGTAVRNTVLTGLSMANNTIVTAADNLLAAAGKLQAQVTAILTTVTSHTNNVANPHNVTKEQVGLSNVDNTPDAEKNVFSAHKLKTARRITLTGDVSGSVLVDGTEDVSLTANVADDSHSHTISNIDGLQEELNAKLIAHPAISQSANTATVSSPSVGGSFTVIDAVTKDSNGHVTQVNTKTVTLPTQTAISGFAGEAANLSGGAAGTLPYQTAANTTAMLAAGTLGQVLKSNGTAPPGWQTLDLSYLPDSTFKKSVRCATTSDLGASLRTAATLTGYSKFQSLACTTTAGSTGITTTTTAGLKVGAVVSTATAAMAAGTTVTGISGAAVFTVANRANIATTAITGTGSVATAVFAAQTYTPYAVGAKITVSGAAPSTYNGTFTVSACTASSVSWSSPEAAAATVQGTISFAIAAGTSITTAFTQSISPLVIDGITVAFNDRILVKNQSAVGGIAATVNRDNGIYSVSTLGTSTVPWVLTRTPDADSITKIAGALVAVDSGTQGGWLFDNDLKATDTLGTTAIVWNASADSGKKLNFFSSTTSNELAGIISDKTGSSSLVFANSPSLTGIPTAPTASSGANTTQIATTAFVQQSMSKAGVGDMLKSVYDSDNDGIVDLSKAAVKLQTSRTLTFTGNLTGSAAFDGSSNVSISSKLAGPVTWSQLKGV